MVATRTIVIAGVITAICAAALTAGIILGLRRDCSTAKEPPSSNVDFYSTNTTISWVSAEENEGCNVTYFLRYHMDDNHETFEVNTTETVHVIDTLVACTVLHVHLWAISETGQMSSGHFMDDFTAYPSAIGPVQDLQVEIGNDDTATVTWNSPSGLDLCNIEFTVTAINVELDENQWTNICTGGSSCEITLSDFCPATVFFVVATSIDGTPVTNAELEAYVHNCVAINVIKAMV